jgi:hypothetical protein
MFQSLSSRSTIARTVTSGGRRLKILPKACSESNKKKYMHFSPLLKEKKTPIRKKCINNIYLKLIAHQIVNILFVISVNS